MAVNIIQGQLGVPVKNVAVAVTNTTTNPTGGAASSGDVCLWNLVPGVAEDNTDSVSGLTVLNTNCIAEVQVNAINTGGNVAVAAGDQIYFLSTDAIPLSKKTTGGKVGIAFGSSILGGGPDIRTGTLIASGASGTIRVWVGKSVG